MKLVYLNKRTPKVKSTPYKDWMELRYASKLANRKAAFLKEIGMSKEEFIKKLLSK